MGLPPGEDGKTCAELLKEYREKVNPELTFVCMDILGRGAAQAGVSTGETPKDLFLCGYSDQVLKYIADRDRDQLADIEGLQRPVKGGKKQRKPPAPAPDVPSAAPPADA
eukprot:NODE_2983_length_432_cov_259.135770_g2479_i0.p2 GENE.NODE_2983_length_432_cov_259.135770_g2479_i0~~NODE_2983_length_432_cov_259.135770_g2479_i0.p2  ORF type:complete len:118 (+),score=33.42 NODE_2983_length_432_cov_259.135770_g2479_i0:27-356(+)